MRDPIELGAGDLVLCSGTLLTHGLREMAAAAEAGGYRAITLWPEDVRGARAGGLSDADIRRLLADHGLVVADLDPLLDWTAEALPQAGQAKIPLAPEDEFYAIAEAFGARSLNVAQGFGSQLDLDVAAEDLAGVCERAALHGLLVTVEFTPWSGIPNAAVALDLVERTGCANATVLVDSWHWFRGGADLEMLRRIPGQRIGSVQLNDAPRLARDDVIVETMQHRLMPGDGAIPLTEVIRVLDEVGSTAPIGVEVFNASHGDRPAEAVAIEAAQATRKILADARG